MRIVLPLLAALTCCVAPALFPGVAAAEESISAADLASQLHTKQQDGSAYIRLKMESTGSAASTLQLQIKSRATRNGSELLYQVLWPKERKGEGVLLQRAGGKASGSLFTPPDKVQPLSSGQMDEALFGSALSYEDVLEDFFGWEKQALVGAEQVDKVPCQILESKPSGGDRSSYSSVKSWIDMRRMVPLRVEKYAGGKLVRRIDTTKVANDDKGRPIPANLTIHGPKGVVTEMDGSRIKHNVEFTDATFSPEQMKDMAVPKGSE